MGRRKPAVCLSVRFDHRDRDVAERVTRAVLEHFLPRLDSAVIDAYSDYRDVMPEDVRAVQDGLRARGRARGKGDEGMGIVLDPRREPDRSAFVTYAPWSIHAEAESADRALELSFHDCASAVVVESSSHAVEDELRRVVAGLGERGLPCSVVVL